MFRGHVEAFMTFMLIHGSDKRNYDYWKCNAVFGDTACIGSLTSYQTVRIACVRGSNGLKTYEL